MQRLRTRKGFNIQEKDCKMWFVRRAGRGGEVIFLMAAHPRVVGEALPDPRAEAAGRGRKHLLLPALLLLLHRPCRHAGAGTAPVLHTSHNVFKSSRTGDFIFLTMITKTI